MNLVRLQIEARPRNGLHSSFLSKMPFIFGKEVEPTPTPTHPDMLFRHGHTKQRCEICLFEISGPGQKKEKDKPQKLKSRCEKCGIAVCEQLSKLICDKHL